MKHLMVFYIIFMLMTSFSFGQNNWEPVIGGIYNKGKGHGAVYVGKKDIARINVTLQAINEYGDATKFIKTKSFIGPMYAHGKYGFTFPDFYLERYPLGKIMKVVVYFRDRSVRVFNSKEAGEMCLQYFQYIYEGY